MHQDPPVSLAFNLAERRTPGGAPSFNGLLRAFGLVVGVGAGIALYVAAFVRLAAPLHLEFTAAYWLGAGGLFILIGVVGVVQLLRGNKTSGALGVYLLVGGCFSFGYGWRRQSLVAHARASCAQALAAARDPQQRIRVLYRDGVNDLADPGRAQVTHLRCRELLQ